MESKNSSVVIEFTPTIPHCSMATLIGLSIRVKLLRCLPSRFKVCGFLLSLKIITEIGYCGVLVAYSEVAISCNSRSMFEFHLEVTYLKKQVSN